MIFRRDGYRDIKKILALGAMLALGACAHQSAKPPIQKNLSQAYADAVRDAEIVEPNEISKNLTAITPLNPALEWSGDRQKVLVTTWTSWDGYDNSVGQTQALSREVWVTVVPEVKNFCRARYKFPEQTILRLEQLLGLPPGDNKTKFVEMWVSPSDLFRPSPDPEISDHEAELDFPVSDRFVTVSKEHKEWFKNLRKTSYGENGYPWTRLGYTYDWGNPESEVGLSEFVIRAGANVKVHSVTKTIKYCE
ncbi:hypothetical protein ONV78_14140 [Hahella sp. CR1]|uniref:hypothetical protein n=1 Tax=Hahella sp. CR1 TaxID=2992807 RepID=UPI002442C3EF|nr:hypothetical protein [Hahella sp. CR1]MDG9668880.1 hypothetical protein [Hahella sp. CR1]